MDRFETLKKYKELLDMGIITQEEFNEKKAKLLSDDPESSQTTPCVDEKRVKDPKTIGTDEKIIGAEEPITVIPMDSDASAGMDDTVVFEGEAGQQVSGEANQSSVHKIPKIALIGIAAVLVVVLAFLLFPKNDAKEIQGSWDMVVITTDGDSSYTTGPIGGSLEIKGNKWTMEIHSLTQDSSFSGTVKLDSKETTEDGTEGYFYDFHNDGEGSLKAIYVPKNGLMTVSTHSYMDTDNCATFKKK